MIECKETDSGFEISWDPNDPVESVFNSWTEEDFIRVIMESANLAIEEYNQSVENNESTN